MTFRSSCEWVPRWSTNFGKWALVGMIHAQMLRDQLFVDPGRIARKDAASGIENDGLVGNLERQLPVLLDQNDRLAFLLQSLDGAADFRNDQRRKAFRRLVEQQNAGIAH